MTAQTMHIAQQFERQGRKIAQGRQMPFKTAPEAVDRARRDAARVAGVVAVSQTVDTDSGEVLEEPVILARHGELPVGLFGE